MKKHIGIFGGAFDPIHAGHLALANTATFWCDEVWLMPAYKHMYDKKMSLSHYRLTMCQFAKAESNPRVCVSPFEIVNEISGGTYELMKRLIEAHPDFKFSFIIGQDNADTIDRWKNYELLIDLVPFLVFPRKGYPMNYDANAWYKKKPHQYLWNADTDQFFKKKNMQISSSKIKEDIKDGVKPENLHRLVYDYILHYKLYDN
jgi:nicotinate-nucleotide adenylyltransferase